MSFTVVTIAREPISVLTTFINWYLGQGAAKIIIYLDDENDPALSAFNDPRLDFRPCTAELWNHLGISADKRFTRRQNTVLTAAFHELKSGWLLAVDADELMQFDNQTIAEAVATFPSDVCSVRVKTAEHVLLEDGQEVFRLPISRTLVNEVFGDQAPLFRPRFGLVGHADGKSFHRANQTGIRLRQHWAQTADGSRINELCIGHEQGAHLLHFVTPNYKTWRAKMSWREESCGFAGPVKDVLRTKSETTDADKDQLELYEALHVLTKEMEAKLDAVGGLLRLPKCW